MASPEIHQNEEIRIFQEYLRIPTVHPDVDYAPCITFLTEQAASLDLPISVVYPGLSDKPIIIITWHGTDDDQPSILLNSHMDVVPVFESYWVHPPFAAEIDDDGRIFARGAQDMKSVGMQYLAAIRALKRDGVRLKRTLHVTFVPDEERGGFTGMGKFIESDAFRQLNIGFGLDEGIASPTEVYPVFYAERSVWMIDLKCRGTSGHGSLLHENTAAEKVRYLLNKVLDRRDAELKKLECDSKLRIGDVTTINVTSLSGGVQSNVIPPEITIGLDIRIAIDVDLSAFQEEFRGWCKEAGEDVELIVSSSSFRPSKNIDNWNPYWVVFKSTLVDQLNLKIEPQVFPGATDSRYLRQKNIPVIGFSPMNHTPILLHEHNEFLKIDTYLEGIRIYKELLQKIANV